MVQSQQSPLKKKNNNHKTKLNNHNNYENGLKQYIKLASIGKISANIINELCNPVDAVNRFLNLALQSIEEDSQSRQFILESKSGVRKMSALLKKLNNYAKKMEKEMRTYGC